MVWEIQDIWLVLRVLLAQDISLLHFKLHLKTHDFRSLKVLKSEFVHGMDRIAPAKHVIYVF